MIHNMLRLLLLYELKWFTISYAYLCYVNKYDTYDVIIVVEWISMTHYEMMIFLLYEQEWYATSCDVITNYDEIQFERLMSLNAYAS